MKATNPYLNFAGNTEEAFTFYKSVFGGEFTDFLRFKDFGANEMEVPDNELDKIAHVALPLGANNLLMGTDALEGWEPVTFGNNYSITLEANTDEEAERLFNGLSDGGQNKMPLQRTEWAEKYGECADKFGVQWIVMYTGNVQFDGSRES